MFSDKKKMYKVKKSSFSDFVIILNPNDACPLPG